MVYSWSPYDLLRVHESWFKRSIAEAEVQTWEAPALDYAQRRGPRCRWFPPLIEVMSWWTSWWRSENSSNIQLMVSQGFFLWICFFRLPECSIWTNWVLLEDMQIPSESSLRSELETQGAHYLGDMCEGTRQKFPCWGSRDPCKSLSFQLPFGG